MAVLAPGSLNFNACIYDITAEKLFLKDLRYAHYTIFINKFKLFHDWDADSRFKINQLEIKVHFPPEPKLGWSIV